MSNGIGSELGFVRREMLDHERCQITIFTKREQVLFVKSIDVAFRIIINDAVGNNDRATLVSCSDPVKRETTRQTSDTAEQTLESLRQVMRDVVFVNLIAQTIAYWYLLFQAGGSLHIPES